jgi:hypothetical protein
VTVGCCSAGRNFNFPQLFVFWDTITDKAIRMPTRAPLGNCVISKFGLYTEGEKMRLIHRESPPEREVKKKQCTQISKAWFDWILGTNKPYPNAPCHILRRTDFNYENVHFSLEKFFFLPPGGFTSVCMWKMWYWRYLWPFSSYFLLKMRISLCMSVNMNFFFITPSIIKTNDKNKTEIFPLLKRNHGYFATCVTE